MLPQLLKPGSVLVRGTSAAIGVALLAGGAIAAPLRLGVTATPSSQPVQVETTPDSAATTTPTTTTTESQTAARPRFSCQAMNGQYTVMYHPESQSGQAYAWATPTALGGGWTPERRCSAISSRLESYRPDGLLELRTAVENNYNTVCVTTQKIAECRIVLTVPPGQDPVVTRDRVFQNLTVADSGQQTSAINTFVSGGNDSLVNQVGQLLNVDLAPLSRGSNSARSYGINLRPFLDPADGGTGARLNRGIPAPQLNPNRFR